LSVCALPRTKVNEQTEEYGLNYMIKIKSVRYFEISSFNKYS
jgi:hypothetical protein